MRQFAAGLILGSLVSAICIIAWTRNGNSAAPAPASTNSPMIRSSATATLAERPVAMPSRAIERQVASEECVVITEDNIDEVVMMLERRVSQRKQLSLAQEPKDPLWAPTMEQQIRLVTSQHRSSSQFNLTLVDCRTVYCRIEAEVPPDSGFREGVDAFFEVAESMRQDLGLQQGSSGSGGMLPNGMVDAHAMFRRYSIGETCPPGYPECWNR